MAINLLIKQKKKGASIAFVKKINSKSNLKQIKVKNTLSALSSLARYYRSLLNTQIIGITGSVGKTGTKDAISFILKFLYQVMHL